MKLVLYIGKDYPHHKNYSAIKRMCNSCGVEFEETRSIHRVMEDNYEILLSCSEYINPELIPSRIKIIFGPQFFVFPTGKIVGRRNEELSKRCVMNSLSKWVKDYWLEIANEFIVPIEYFPFAVDTNLFEPLFLEKEFDCIIYIKHRSHTIINEVLNIVNQKKMKYNIIVYGSYNEMDYINLLQKSKFMISLDAHESQGFGLEEAMSCNVPLLVMNATTMYRKNLEQSLM